MILQDVYSEIVFKIGTPDDTSARSANPQVSNQRILAELLSQMRSYARVTKGIQDIYSVALDRNTPFFPAPTLALRSRAYFFCYVVVNGAIFPIDFRGPKSVYPNFRINPMNGITNWLMPFNMGHTTYFGAYPANSTDAKTTTLTGDVGLSDTVINVASTAGFLNTFGKVTIDSEVIMYSSITPTTLVGCVRGDEMSTPATHSSTTIVTQNNLIMFYSRLPIPFAANSDNTISSQTLNMVLEPCDEHMEGIMKAAEYNLLNKINPQRAESYKIDAVALYVDYADDIEKAYARNRQNVNVRNPYSSNESGVPFGNNLL